MQTSGCSQAAPEWIPGLLRQARWSGLLKQYALW